MAATDALPWRQRLRSWAGQLAQQLLRRPLGAALAGLLPVAPTQAVDLPEDRVEAMFHRYDGGGVQADGPALLVRKSLTDRVSLSGTYYVDAVSNASIDVVTNASPYRERRVETGLGLSTVVRDTLLTLAASRSDEPDYRSDSASLDVAQEVFGGMSTLSLGFGRGDDQIGQHGVVGTLDSARRWQYRLGLTQVLSPRWLASLNTEAIAEDGFLGSVYRPARVFGAAVPERHPRTRSSRAVKLRLVGDIGNAEVRDAIRLEYRQYWDTWAVRAGTLEAGYSRYFGPEWLADFTLRHNQQHHALFYSDNASSETTYVSRNRQLASFVSNSLGARLSWTAAAVPGRYELRLNAALERVHFDYSDFTDIRTGKPYAFDGTVAQVYVSANF